MWTVELRTQTLTANTTSYTLDTDLVDVLEAVITEASDANTDIEVDRISRAEYLNISQKSQTGTPVQYFLPEILLLLHCFYILHQMRQIHLNIMV